MPSQSRQTGPVPMQRPQPEHDTRRDGGIGNAGLLEMLGLNRQAEIPSPLLAIAEQAPESLPIFPGYEDPWHQANDALIVEVVADFNQEKGWTSDHANYLDPALVKSWALQESGGHKKIFSSGDMMQMNVAGDWAKEKTQFGITGKHEKLDPRKSLEVALRWAYYKGELTRAKAADTASDGWHDTQRGTKSVPGYESQFQGWEEGLTDYNGGGVQKYYDQINNRRQAVE